MKGVFPRAAGFFIAVIATFGSPAWSQTPERYNVVPVASIEIEGPRVLPLGQHLVLRIVARDAGGNPIASGKLNPPIEVNAATLEFTSGRRSLVVFDASDLQRVEAMWPLGSDASRGGSVVASDGQRSARLDVTASSGFAYYELGNDWRLGANPRGGYIIHAGQYVPGTSGLDWVTDHAGTALTAGPDGDLYYGTTGPIVQYGTPVGHALCPRFPVPCSITDGVVGRLDPRTGRSSEIELHTGVLSILFSSDGALWIGGSSGDVFRLPPRRFAAGALQHVGDLPADHLITSFAQDRNQRIWFAIGPRLYSIPLGGPYSAASLRAHELPQGAAGTSQSQASASDLLYANGSLYVSDEANGVIDRINPQTGATTARFSIPFSAAQHPDGVPSRLSFMANSRELLVTQTDRRGCAGAISRIRDDLTAMNRYTLPQVSGGIQPDWVASNAIGGGYFAGYQSCALDKYGGLGYVHPNTGDVRFAPIDASTAPAGIVAGKGSSVWFLCAGGSGGEHKLCAARAIYLKRWSLFPSLMLSIDGYGSWNARTVGIFEAPNADSGPFSVKSSDVGICTVNDVAGHNFNITPVEPGTCGVVVTDAKGASQKMTVSVRPPLPAP